MANLRKIYKCLKLKKIALIVGGSILGLGALAGIIACLILYPPSFRTSISLARALLPILKQNAIELAKLIVSVYVMLTKRSYF